MANYKLSAFLSIALISLAIVGSYLAINGRNQMLENSSNTTSFSKWAQCYTNLNATSCEDVKNNSTELALCYSSSYGVGQLTYDGSNQTTAECHNFRQYFDNATSTDLINFGDHYFNCFLSGDVLKIAYQSEYYYDKVYTPIYITCAGY
ncbi:hypothetical protein ABPG72_019455 [Tetrahymena utriculariae]